MKNKVAVFSKSFPPSLNVSSFRISAYCKAMLDDGWDVSVFTDFAHGDNFLKKYVSGADVHYSSSKSNLTSFLFYLFSAIKIIASRKYSCVFITGGPFYYFLMAPLFRIFKVRVILDFRDPWCLRPEVNSKRYLIYRYFERLVI